MRKHYTKYIVLVSFLLFSAGYLFIKHGVSVEALLALTPKDPIKATLVLLLLYALKSATVFFPLVILEIAVGHLFSTGVALGINFAGILIVLTIPYWIGRAAGIDVIQKLIQRYPRFATILGKQQNNALFLCFFLRIISCLPGDVVTMYLGATKTPFWKNVIAGTLGVLPGMILATLMGNSIQDPSSPAFWVSAILMVTFAALSVLLYYLYRRRVEKKNNGSKQQ